MCTRLQLCNGEALGLAVMKTLLAAGGEEEASEKKKPVKRDKPLMKIISSSREPLGPVFGESATREEEKKGELWQGNMLFPISHLA